MCADDTAIDPGCQFSVGFDAPKTYTDCADRRPDCTDGLTAGAVLISKHCMAAIRPPEFGTLVIAALLLLVLGFAGYWIIQYANPDLVLTPWDLIKWFLVGGVIIIVLGFLLFVGTTRSSREK
jgi:hypothetical protein